MVQAICCVRVGMKVRRKKIHGNGKSETKRNECSESQNYFCMFVRKSGPLCRVCSSGYYLDSATGYCEDCDDAGSGSNISALFVIFAVLLLAGLVCMYRRRRRQRAARIKSPKRGPVRHPGAILEALGSPKGSQVIFPLLF